jgi:hypothetical protein
MATIAISRPRRTGADVLAACVRRLCAIERRIHRALCGLHGHDFLIRREPFRICLECPNCGYQTPGWLLAGRQSGAARTSVLLGKLRSDVVDALGSDDALIRRAIRQPDVNVVRRRERARDRQRRVA